MKTYHIITYGCQMNRSDSERLGTVLTSYGLSPVATPHEADVIIINACSVRQSAIDRIWGNLKHFEKWKMTRPLVTILTGCVLPSDKQKFQTQFDAVVPIKEIQSLPDIISSLSTSPTVIPNPIGNLKKKTKVERLSSRVPMQHRDVAISYFTNQPLTPISQNVVSNNYLNIRPKHISKFSAFVPIMTGCNAFCTYCAVPYTRGAEENRRPKEIIQEVEDLVMNKHYKEVTLLGQIINKYNVRADDEFFKFLEGFKAKYKLELSFLDNLKTSEKRIFKFHHLLETLGRLPRKFWLRFTSSHPNWFADELITTIRDISNIPKHFHLPVQAGSNSVLLRMRRPYHIDHYLNLIKKIREQIPLATITTDCIVGFSGETEEEFQESLKIFETVHYDMAFIAQYSPRPNTYAYKNLPDDVPLKIKKEREKRLTEVLKRTALENNQQLVGRTFDVLIHEKMGPNLFSGVSENSKHVHVHSIQDLPVGDFTQVTIDLAHPWSLHGKAAT